MGTLKVKTNINCSSCVEKVTPFLNQEQSIDNWEVDTSGPGKELTVTGNNISKEKVEEVLAKAGFRIKS